MAPETTNEVTKDRIDNSVRKGIAEMCGQLSDLASEMTDIDVKQGIQHGFQLKNESDCGGPGFSKRVRDISLYLGLVLHKRIVAKVIEIGTDKPSGVEGFARLVRHKTESIKSPDGYSVYVSRYCVEKGCWFRRSKVDIKYQIVVDECVDGTFDVKLVILKD